MTDGKKEREGVSVAGRKIRILIPRLYLLMTSALHDENSLGKEDLYTKPLERLGSSAQESNESKFADDSRPSSYPINGFQAQLDGMPHIFSKSSSSSQENDHYTAAELWRTWKRHRGRISGHVRPQFHIQGCRPQAEDPVRATYYR